MGYVEVSRIKDFSCPSILWSIDNSLFNYWLILPGHPFRNNGPLWHDPNTG